MRTFDFFGKQLPYLEQEQGIKEYGERTIEVPIALEFLKLFNPKLIVEIGAVIPEWTNIERVNHIVIDPFDPYPHALRIDCEEYIYTGLNVLSISTIEHIGKEEYGNTEIDPMKSIRCFEKILNESKNYLITFPVGYNKILDDHIRTSKVNRFMYKKIDDNEWGNLWKKKIGISYMVLLFLLETVQFLYPIY